MRRALVLAIAALGAAISLVAGELYAALTDTARTGTNTVTSAALPPSADLQIAVATVAPDGTLNCGTYADNLTSGLITAAGLVPSTSSATTFAYICLKNLGSQAVTLTAKTEDLVDVETGCTGDESIYDTTCGNDAVGELSSVLKVRYETLTTCSATSSSSYTEATLAENTTTASLLGGLAAGASKCYDVFGEFSRLATDPALQAAQSDQATWRIRFDVTA